jgi:hypothetical protein
MLQVTWRLNLQRFMLSFVHMYTFKLSFQKVLHTSSLSSIHLRQPAMTSIIRKQQLSSKRNTTMSSSAYMALRRNRHHGDPPRTSTGGVLLPSCSRASRSQSRIMTDSLILGSLNKALSTV